MVKKKIYLILAIIMAFSLVAEVLFAHPHFHMPWNVIPGADILLGFAGAWLLIFLAKILLANILQRAENYYDTENVTVKEGGEHDA